MKILYLSGFNTNLEEKNLYMPDLFRIIARLSLGYEKIVVNVSSCLEMSIFKFLKDYFKNSDKHKIVSHEEIDLKSTEVEYDNYLNSLNFIKTNSPTLKGDVVMSTKFMDAGNDVLLLSDKTNEIIVNFALVYAKEIGVHSYAVEMEKLHLRD